MARAPVTPDRSRRRDAGSPDGGAAAGRQTRVAARKRRHRLGRLEQCILVLVLLTVLSLVVVEVFAGTGTPSSKLPSPQGLVRTESAAQAGRTVRLDADKTAGVLLVSRWASDAFCSPTGGIAGNPLDVAGLRSFYARDVAAGGVATGLATVKAALGHKGFADLAGLSTGRAHVNLCEVRVQVEGLFQGGGALGAQYSQLSGAKQFVYTAPLGIEMSFSDASGNHHLLLVEMVSAGNRYGGVKIERVGPLLAFYEERGTASRASWILVAGGTDSDGTEVVLPPTGTLFAPGVAESPAGQLAPPPPGSIIATVPYHGVGRHVTRSTSTKKGS
jgi:hypothetical protein